MVLYTPPVAVLVATLSAIILALDVCLFWPLVSILGSLVLTAGLWHGMRLRLTDVTEQTGWVGGVVIFGQVLDAITTMIGIDRLGFTEEVYLSRLIIESTARLPMAELLGTTWLFVGIKCGLVVGIVTLVARTENASSGERWLLLGIVFLAGFGPALNNLTLQLTV